MELKPKFDGLQELFNRCINHAFRVLTDRITAKSAYLDCEQMRELERQEYIRTADELAQLYLRYSVLSDMPIAETDNPFDSTLNDEQIAFLAEGINDVKMFNVPLTPDDLTAIFAGKPHAIVRSNNNRLVAFFFSGLSSRGLITPNWQSVIANCKLFLSKDRSRDKYINQSDLSSATNYIRDIGVVGKYATIERYLKQVKKL